jgi:hydroxymethylpyrimidine pyrophosphatase-like HAD family hydrolase
MEVFNPDVSKSKGIEWLINHLQLTDPYVFAIGNDYNDLDMLNFAHSSFAVSNAPQELKEKFQVTKSNNENGFTKAIKTLNI